MKLGAASVFKPKGSAFWLLGQHSTAGLLGGCVAPGGVALHWPLYCTTRAPSPHPCSRRTIGSLTSSDSFSSSSQFCSVSSES